MMQLYLIHCGFYDPEFGEGLYESHTNFFTLAEDFMQARHQAKLIPDFVKKRMHIDGLIEIAAVEGFRLSFEWDEALEGRTSLNTNRFRELAPAPKT